LSSFLFLKLFQQANGLLVAYSTTHVKQNAHAG